MYGQIKFQDFEIRKETKFSKLSYYYKKQKIDEKELKKYIDKEKIEKAKSVFINNGINECVIEKNLFRFCYDLISIKIPEDITNIGHHAFSCCTNLRNVEIPSSVTIIGNDAFNSCVNLKDIVTSIGWNAFYGCTNLTSVEIPESVINIEEGAFYKCPKLKEIITLNKNIKIDKDAFDKNIKIIRKEDQNKDLATIIKDYTIDKDKNDIENELEK